LGMRNEATPNSVLNCFGDENWSNPWIRPNRHPSRWGGGARAGDFPLTFFYLLSVWSYLLSPKLLSIGGARVGGRMGGGARGGGQQGKGPGEGGGTGGGLPSGRRSWVPTSMPISAANATGTR
jgi:hypothetical protein